MFSSYSSKLLALELIIITGIPIAFSSPISSSIPSSDRLYSADQSSNTITVTKPATNEVLGTITLGDPRLSDELNPQYLKPIASHGLGFSPNGEFISHVSVTSSQLTVIRTLNNTIVSQTSVDRASHEAGFEHDGKTVWVACRGTSNVDLVDALNGGVIGRVVTEPGPSKVLFSPDGKLAYVNHVSSATLSIVDVASRKVVDIITGLGDTFSSDMAINPDGTSIWAVHKMTGTMSIIDLTARKVVTVLDTGTESNHPTFANFKGTLYGFVTVAAANETKVYSQNSPSAVPSFVRAIKAGGIEPHGIATSGDGRHVYWVNEHSDTLDVVDLSVMQVTATLPIGQESQALIYVPNAVPSGSGLQNLGTQGLGKRVENRLLPVTNSSESSALVTVRALDGLDMVQVIGRKLEVNGTYVVTAEGSGGARLQVVSFVASMLDKENPGCAVAPQVLSFLPFFVNYELESVEIEKV
jgi:YVTN family beta-propeller protein